MDNRDILNLLKKYQQENSPVTDVEDVAVYPSSMRLIPDRVIPLDPSPSIPSSARIMPDRAEDFNRYEDLLQKLKVNKPERNNNLSVKDDNLLDKPESELVTPSAFSMQGLLDALKASRNAQLASNIGLAGSAMMAQMAGTQDKFSPVFKEQLEQAKSIPDEYTQTIQMEKHDPNSQISRQYRETAKELGFKNIAEGASAANLEKLIPQLTNLATQREAKESRELLAREARADRALQRDIALGERQKQKEEKTEARKEELATKAIDNYAKTASKQYETVSTLQQAVENLDLKNIEESGPKDVAALYSFIKLLDPDSVVREGELALARAGMSVPQNLRAIVKNITVGGTMDKSYRKQMAVIGKELAKQGVARYHRGLQGHRNVLKERFGLTDEDIKLYDPVLAAEEHNKEQPEKFVSKSGLTPEQRRKRIEELKARRGQ